jgi:hypothetical protein
MNPLGTQFRSAAYDIEAVVRTHSTVPSTTGEVYLNHRKQVRPVIGTRAITFTDARVAVRLGKNEPLSQLPVEDDLLDDLYDEGRKFAVFMNFNVETLVAAALLHHLSPRLLDTVPRQFRFRKFVACGEGDHGAQLKFIYRP